MGGGGVITGNYENVLLGKLCQSPNGLNTVQSHDEILQLPHVLDCKSQSCLRDCLLLFSATVDFSQQRVLVGKQLMDEVLDWAVSVCKLRDQVLDLDSLEKVSGRAKMFVLWKSMG